MIGFTGQGCALHEIDSDRTQSIPFVPMGRYFFNPHHMSSKFLKTGILEYEGSGRRKQN